MGYRMKKNNKSFDFGNKGNFDIKSEKTKNKRDYTAQPERDYSEHNIAARKTEGTIEEQEARRKKNSPNKIWGKIIDTAVGVLKEDTAAVERAENKKISAASIQRK